MSISKDAVTLLVRTHPHSAAILKAFTPLLAAQDSLAESLPPPVLPALDQASFAQGKAWVLPADMASDVFLDDAFIKASPKKIAAAAAKGLPAIKDEIRALGAFLSKNSAACRELALFCLQKRMNKIKAWAKKNGQNEAATSLFAVHLAGAAAKRVARTARASNMPAWKKGYCPICGSRPHATFLTGSEGRRFLQCSMCRHEWRFSRTACPVCEQESPRELPVFFLEDHKEERAEACEACKHYLLGLDMRPLSGDTPLELFVLCMMPLDLLMQEKGYVPAATAG